MDVDRCTLFGCLNFLLLIFLFETTSSQVRRDSNNVTRQALARNSLQGSYRGQRSSDEPHCDSRGETVLYPCQAGELQYTTDTSLHCLVLTVNPANWTSQVTLCQWKGGSLAVLKSDAIRKLLTDALSKKSEKYWIGLKRDHRSQPLKWLDGSAFDKRQEASIKWQDDSTLNCVYASREFWNTALCRNYFRAVCMYEPVIEPVGVTLFTNGSGQQHIVGERLKFTCNAVQTATDLAFMVFTHSDGVTATFKSDGTKTGDFSRLEGLHSSTNTFEFKVLDVCYSKSSLTVVIAATMAQEGMEVKCCLTKDVCDVLPVMSVEFKTFAPALTVATVDEAAVAIVGETYLCRCYASLGQSEWFTVSIINGSWDTPWTKYINVRDSEEPKPELEDGLVLMSVVKEVDNMLKGGNVVEVTVGGKVTLGMNSTVCACYSYDKRVSVDAATEQRLSTVSKPLTVVVTGKAPKLFVRYHHPPSTVIAGREVLASCSVTLADTDVIMWEVRGPRLLKTRRWIVRQGEKHKFGVSYGYTITRSKGRHNSLGGGKSPPQNMTPMNSTLRVTVGGELNGATVACLAGNPVVPRTLLRTASRPLSVFYLPQQPRLEVNYHLGPHFALVGHLFSIRCICYVGTNGTLAWRLSNEVRNVTKHWRADRDHGRKVMSVLRKENAEDGKDLNPFAKSTLFIYVENHLLHGSTLTCVVINDKAFPRLTNTSVMEASSHLLLAITAPQLYVGFHDAPSTVYANRKLKARCHGSMGQDGTISWLLKTAAGEVKIWTQSHIKESKDNPVEAEIQNESCESTEEEDITACYSSTITLVPDITMDNSILACKIALDPNIFSGVAQVVNSRLFLVQYEALKPSISVFLEEKVNMSLLTVTCSAYVGDEGQMTLSVFNDEGISYSSFFVNLTKQTDRSELDFPLEIMGIVVNLNSTVLGPRIIVKAETTVSQVSLGSIIACYSYNTKGKSGDPRNTDDKLRSISTIQHHPFAFFHFEQTYSVRVTLFVIILTVVLVGGIVGRPPTLPPDPSSLPEKTSCCHKIRNFLRRVACLAGRARTAIPDPEPNRDSLDSRVEMEANADKALQDDGLSPPSPRIYKDSIRASRRMSMPTHLLFHHGGNPELGSLTDLVPGGWPRVTTVLSKEGYVETSVW